MSNHLKNKLELICDELNRYQVPKYGITLTTSVVPYPLEAMGYNWYIMPEGGAYVWDSWRTTRDSNPNIVMFVRFHTDYRLDEGGSGPATVFDHPLHISLFTGNYRALPPHLRSIARPLRLLPPHAITPVYPQYLETTLRRSDGLISRLHFAAHRRGIAYQRAYRIPVERSPPTSD
jgi:hypothetical protein